jgi:hypothetical protein
MDADLTRHPCSMQRTSFAFAAQQASSTASFSVALFVAGMPRETIARALSSCILFNQWLNFPASSASDS